MKRLVLAFLLLALATLTIPGLRQQVEPEIDEARIWLGEKLEGPLAPVLTPYRSVRTETRMAEAASVLVRNRNLGAPAPNPSDFRQLLESQEVDPLDAWGVPLIMLQDPDSVAIVSAGPDLKYDSDDDLITKIRYKAPRRRLLRR